jgi:hypothetical protein
MSSPSSPYRALPVPRRDDGNPRRVGFEIEFGGITLAHAARVLGEGLGVEPVEESAARWRFEPDRSEPFVLETDWAYLKEQAAAAEVDESGRAWVDILETAAELLVPAELVCPPIAVDELARLDPLVAGLREAGAVGTADSIVAAFGIHVNTEAPSLEASSIAGYVRAFALLQWWLVHVHEVDFARRVTPYVDLWPRAYLEVVLERDEPSMQTLFDDYLAHNATRNRSLDLLPLLAEVDEARIRDAVPDPRIHARPAYHYRLPDCRIEDPDWSLAQPWSRWVVVEELAGRPDLVEKLAHRFLEPGRGLFGVRRKTWVDTIGGWLCDRGWA